MRSGWPPQHYHPENAVVGDVEHDIHTWTIDSVGPIVRVVMWTITDGRTDGRTMAVGASVTWTHCSVCYEVT
jgi:hypothetical protein